MAQPRPGSAGEVFRAFLALGLTAFGGPVAHLGYFRTAFVERRAWLSDAAYGDIVALCQFLPGPASSQVGMAIGLHRAGVAGMAAAWAAFTLPSAVLLVAFAYGLGVLGDVAGAGWIHGLKAAAVAVVAQALLGMARTLAPDRERASIAVAALALALALPGPAGGVAVIAAGALAGFLLPSRAVPAVGDDAGFRVPVPRSAAVALLAVFFLLLVLLPALAQENAVLALVDRFYRAGALVFGGGHVVLPLLQAEMVATGQVTTDTFLAGYGAAQAVPGPLFTFAAFLGAAAVHPPSGVAGAAIALVAIFLPSFLLVPAALPLWTGLRRSAVARRALAGVNAAVVGLLAAALYDPVFTQGIDGPAALTLAAAAFVALTLWRAPPWAVVIAAGVGGGFAL